jgi:superoxide dismutase
MGLSAGGRGTLADAINSAFGNFDEFKLSLELLQSDVWFWMVWLIVDSSGKLQPLTPNQDNP